MLSLRTHKVTAILGIIMSIILCLTFTNTSAFAAVIPNIASTAPPAPISTQGAGGYNSRTYTAPAANKTFTLVPSSYDSRAKLTCEVKSIDSGITSVWMEVTSNKNGTCIWSGFIDAVSNMKSETWFYMASNDTYTVRVNVTGSGKVTVAASLWS